MITYIVAYTCDSELVCEYDDFEEARLAIVRAAQDDLDDPLVSVCFPSQITAEMIAAITPQGGIALLPAGDTAWLVEYSEN